MPALAEINITPLIDVMLVLLVIFMIVTPVATRSLDVALPEERPGDAPPPPTPLVLQLDDSGFRLNQAPVATLADLDARLRDALAARSDHTVFVRAAGRVRYGRVVEAMDVARGAGADRIGILREATPQRKGLTTRTVP